MGKINVCDKIVMKKKKIWKLKKFIHKSPPKRCHKSRSHTEYLLQTDCIIVLDSYTSTLRRNLISLAMFNAIFWKIGGGLLFLGHPVHGAYELPARKIHTFLWACV